MGAPVWSSFVLDGQRMNTWIIIHDRTDLDTVYVTLVSLPFAQGSLGIYILIVPHDRASLEFHLSSLCLSVFKWHYKDHSSSHRKVDVTFPTELDSQFGKVPVVADKWAVMVVLSSGLLR